MKKMLKVVAMMLALLIASGCMIAFAENTEEGTTEEVAVEAPQATEEPKAEEPKEEKAEVAEPTVEPTAEPIVEPTVEATTEPTAEVTAEPSVEPIAETATEPSAEPAVEVSAEPTAEAAEETSSDEAAEGVEFIEEDTDETETDDGLVIIEDAPVPLAAPVRSVRIFTTLDSVISEGDKVKLTSELIGFEDVRVALQWQYSDNRGENWKNVDGANEDHYTYAVSSENINYAWRLMVEIVD
ncbi:MAG: hypothetical protein GX647_14050 [Clostridiales bacterium]|nr:hypothetical protein [Clostridiales bacterium]